MMTLLLFIFHFIVVIGTVLLFIFKQPDFKTVEPFLMVLFGISFGAIITNIANSWGHLRLIPRLVMLSVQGRPLRISFATLIRIKVNNKYLLVKSKRNDLFQPPGGVLKFYDKLIREKFHLTDDKSSFSKLPDDEFRLNFEPGHAWRIFSFLKWFDSNKGRELDPYREFYEELVQTNILHHNLFATPKFSYVCRRMPAIKFGNHFQIHEMFLFEIFELVLTDSQKKFIEELQNSTSSKDFVFMERAQIDREGFDGNSTTAVGSHTKWIVN